MSINDLKEKIKYFLASDGARDVYISLVIILVAISAFGLGRLSKANLDGPGIVVQYPDGNQSPYGAFSETAAAPDDVSDVFAKDIFASKNGTRYYFSSCTGAGKIKEENKVWFSTEAQAQAAGFTKSSTCK